MASLLNEKVYSIPMIFVIGWRGEPGIHDEPQHVFQGEVTLKLLEDMGISSFIISSDTSDEEVKNAMSSFSEKLQNGQDVAFVICKGALTEAPKVAYSNIFSMKREEIIEHIVEISEENPIISTTKISLLKVVEGCGRKTKLWKVVEEKQSCGKLWKNLV